MKVKLPGAVIEPVSSSLKGFSKQTCDSRLHGAIAPPPLTRQQTRPLCSRRASVAYLQSPQISSRAFSTSPTSSRNTSGPKEVQDHFPWHQEYRKKVNYQGDRPPPHHSSIQVPTIQSRPFSTSLTLLKKGAKAARDASSSSTSTTTDDDPYDITALETEISATITRLKEDLSKLRSGGRFNPEVLESLRVQPPKNSSESTSSIRLSDIAQLVPKGRTIQILVSEAEYTKPVSSSILAANLSLTPQPDPTGQNPLMLVVNIPPPTADSRKAAVAAATKAGEAAGLGIRSARGVQQKRLRAMQLAKSARPDDLKKAGVVMEKAVEKGTAEVKRVVDGAKKVLDS